MGAQEDRCGIRASLCLTPLEPIRQHVTVLSGLDKPFSRTGDGHYAKTANFLTGLHVRKTTGQDLNSGGVSVDQVAAARMGHLTPLPSLELATDPVINGLDRAVNYTRMYGSYISWLRPNVPLPRIIDPHAAFERMFGPRDADGRPMPQPPHAADQESAGRRACRRAQPESPAGPKRPRKARRVPRLSPERGKEAGPAGRRKLASTHPAPRPHSSAQHAASPDSVHQQRQRRRQGNAPRRSPDRSAQGGSPDARLDGPGVLDRYDPQHDLHVRQRRLAAQFLVPPGRDRKPPLLSHHANAKAKIESYKIITRWHVEQYRLSLGRLASIREGDRTLLDNSMIMCGSSISDGNRHDPNNLPVLLGGKGGGGIKSGQHIASSRNTPLCNLYLSMLHCMGVDVPRFGDSTAPIQGLLA